MNQVLHIAVHSPAPAAGEDLYYYYKVANFEEQTHRPSLTKIIALVTKDLESQGKLHLLHGSKSRATTSSLTSTSNPELKSTTTMTRFPALQVNGLSSVREDPDKITPVERTAEREDRKLAMLRRMRPPPLKFAWAFYHDKHSETPGSYEGRLTLIAGDIITLKPFWGVLNNFPFHALKMKDSVHFFKRGVKPVWEDSRNINGGSWTFRVQKDKSEQFFQEVLMLAVGEQFAPALQPRDDICGLSFSARFNSNLITIWNRDGSNTLSINDILTTVLDKLSPELKPKEGSYYYKKHSEHAGYEESVAGAKEAAKKKLEDHEARKAAEVGEEEIQDAVVTVEEGNKALLKEAEGEDVRSLEEEAKGTVGGVVAKGSPLKGEIKAKEVQTE